MWRTEFQQSGQSKSTVCLLSAGMIVIYDIELLKLIGALGLAPTSRLSLCGI